MTQSSQQFDVVIARADLVDGIGPMQHDVDVVVVGDRIMSIAKVGALDGPGAAFTMALADWGYAPRYLSRFVRDMKLVSVEAAVQRMCSGPAAQFGLPDRGTVEVGKTADLVVFDAQTTGTTVAPHSLRQLPTGIAQRP